MTEERNEEPPNTARNPSIQIVADGHKHNTAPSPDLIAIPQVTPASHQLAHHRLRVLTRIDPDPLTVDLPLCILLLEALPQAARLQAPGRAGDVALHATGDDVDDMDAERREFGPKRVPV